MDKLSLELAALGRRDCETMKRLHDILEAADMSGAADAVENEALWAGCDWASYQMGPIPRGRTDPPEDADQIFDPNPPDPVRWSAEYARDPRCNTR